MEKNEKKNYSIIIAIALIAILVVAMICIGCSKKNGEENQLPEGSGDSMNENVVSGNVEDYPIAINPSAENFPDLEKNTEKDEMGNKINVSPNINKEKMTFDFLELTNISLKYADGMTDFRANIKNNSDVDYPEGLNLKITFEDSEGRYIFQTNLLTSSLKAQGETNLQGRFTIDCTYADTLDIEVIK